MARNEEKQLGQLNRLYMQKEEEERRRKFPPRPKLHTLHTAAEVSKHLKSIIKDIDTSIKMSQVTCYTQEASERHLAAADRYRREYEAFVRKLKLLDSSAVVGRQPIVWSDRPYDRKQAAPATGGSAANEEDRQDNNGLLEASTGSNDNLPDQAIEAGYDRPKRLCRIESPLLDEECRVQQSAAASNVALEEWVARTTPAKAVQDAPLQFSASLSNRSSTPACLAFPRGHPYENDACRSTKSGCSGARLFSSSAGNVLSSSESGSRSMQCYVGTVQPHQDANALALTVRGGSSRSDGVGGSSGCSSGLVQLCQLYGDEGSSLDGEASSEGEAET